MSPYTNKSSKPQELGKLVRGTSPWRIYEMSKGSFFEDRDGLLRVWLDERRSRDFSASLMWENIKFFCSFISALITADTFFISFVEEFKLQAPSQQLILIPILPSIVIAMSILGQRELKRRWSRTLEAIAHLLKLESLLGLNDPLSGKISIFTNDEYLFDRYAKGKNEIKSEDDFRKEQDKRRNMDNDLKWIYIITCIIGITLALIHISLIMGLV
jgi:hypothetical protein